LLNLQNLYRPLTMRKATLITALVASLCCLPATAIEIEGESNFLVSTFSSFTDRATQLAIEAMSLVGINYRRGGNSPENGLDCSGFVRYVFREAQGKELPRTSAEISKLGESVDKQDLQPGDLVFFNTLRRAFSHVGIYLGDNKFIHSPSTGGAVRIESMDLSYWKARFNGARRIETNENIPANR
jgi:cell wall-associated NlpC family hydrolase